MRARTLVSAFALTALLSGVAAAAPKPAAPPVATAQQVKPRQVVAGIAQAIEDRYFDPAKGKQIADDLRAAAAKGEFDALTDPRDLAQALTRRLQPLDHHFNISWPVEPPPEGQGPGGPGPGPGPRPQGDNPFEVRENYGFRHADILPGNIGYIDLHQFSDIDFDDPNSGARAAADAALAMVSHTDAVIIDLRDNGGGSPAMVGYLTSAFTPKGADIYNTFHSRRGDMSEAPGVYYPHPRLTVPVYILISARTGSAAEALTYTLQTAGRAVIVGETSGGAANPGGPVPAGNRFAVFVSQGAPENPISHKNWEGGGVQPDVAVPAAEALTRARILILENLAKADMPDDQKTANQWALEGLRAENAPPLAINAGDYVGAYSGVTIAATPDGLTYQRGRRPAWSLVALGPDRFTVRGEPTRRITFQRDASGKVVALDFTTADGPSQHMRRGE
ncbi:MAG: peptidase family protein [Caulobacter sp.]|nr:peptidase family protein [Caulobacter sp.]